MTDYIFSLLDNYFIEWAIVILVKVLLSRKIKVIGFRGRNGDDYVA